jgi:hypothetical protein
LVGQDEGAAAAPQLRAQMNPLGLQRLADPLVKELFGFVGYAGTSSASWCSAMMSHERGAKNTEGRWWTSPGATADAEQHELVGRASDSSW